MQEKSPTISLFRLAGAGAITLAAIFAICWVAVFLPFPSATHSYVGLFTSAAPESGTALVQGAFWSAVFGLIAGAFGALAYNILGPRRS